MRTLRRQYNFITRLICLSLALYFLNFSVDSRDADPDSVPEDLTINDIESFSELLAEVVFDWTNAFEEHDERDGEEGGALDLTKEYFYSSQEVVAILPPFNPIVPKKYHVRDIKEIASLSVDVTSPPPKG